MPTAAGNPIGQDDFGLGDERNTSGNIREEDHGWMPMWFDNKASLSSRARRRLKAIRDCLPKERIKSLPDLRAKAHFGGARTRLATADGPS